MANNEGFSNLAAAILAFLGGRAKARGEERRERRKEEREDVRTRENRAFLKEMEGMRGSREEKMRGEEMGLRREVLERAYPKKGLMDKFWDTLQGVINPSAQDRLTRAQAGLFEAQAGLVRRTPGTASMGKGRGGGRAGRPKLPKPPGLVDPGTFLDNTAKDVVTGIISGYRTNRRDTSPGSIAKGAKGMLRMRLPDIEAAIQRKLGEEEIAAMDTLIDEHSKSYLVSPPSTGTRKNPSGRAGFMR